MDDCKHFMRAIPSSRISEYSSLPGVEDLLNMVPLQRGPSPVKRSSTSTTATTKGVPSIPIGGLITTVPYEVATGWYNPLSKWTKKMIEKVKSMDLDRDGLYAAYFQRTQRQTYGADKVKRKEVTRCDSEHTLVVQAKPVSNVRHTEVERERRDRHRDFQMQSDLRSSDITYELAKESILEYKSVEGQSDSAGGHNRRSKLPGKDTQLFGSIFQHDFGAIVALSEHHGRLDAETRCSDLEARYADLEARYLLKQQAKLDAEARCSDLEALYSSEHEARLNAEAQHLSEHHSKLRERRGRLDSEARCAVVEAELAELAESKQAILIEHYSSRRRSDTLEPLLWTPSAASERCNWSRCSVSPTVTDHKTDPSNFSPVPPNTQTRQSLGVPDIKDENTSLYNHSLRNHFSHTTSKREREDGTCYDTLDRVLSRPRKVLKQSHQVNRIINRGFTPGRCLSPSHSPPGQSEDRSFEDS